MTALILVDIQNDFLPGGTLPVPEGDQIISVINRVQPLFPLIVATQDWHPANHLSFAANHPGQTPGTLIELAGLPQILWPVHCVQETPGANFAPDLNREQWKRIFPKGTDPQIDSYSGFFDNGHRKATGLGGFLLEKGVTDVCVAGLATDYCVKYTALDAASLGFRTRLIEDACRGVNLQPSDVADAIDEMLRSGIQIIASDQIAGADVR